MQQQQVQQQHLVTNRPNIFPFLTHNEATVVIATRASQLANNDEPKIESIARPTTPEELPSWEMKVAYLELISGKLDDMIIDRQGHKIRIGSLLLRRDY